jgi:Putative Ig domain
LAVFAVADSIRQLGKSTLVVLAFALLLPAGAGAHCWDGPFSDPAELIHCGDGQEQIEDAELPPAMVGAHYAYLFEYDQQSVSTFVVKEGDLPDGLSLDENGLLSGVPTAIGHFSFVVLTYNHVTGGVEQHVTIDVVAPPELTLSPADAITQTTAVLHGRVAPGNFAADVWFEYWPTGAPSPLNTTVETIGGGVDPVEVIREIAGLSPATEYSFRLAATSELSPDPIYSETGALKTAEPIKPPEPVIAAAIPPSTELPPPQAGKSFNIKPAGGVVSTKCSDDGAFRRLDKPKQVTLDCQIDAEDGTVSVTASKGSSGATQTALFWGSTFDIDQEAGDNREAVMTLAGERRCEKRGDGMGDRRQRSRRGSSGRKLWGSGSGNYKTVGSHGSATVRGTIWLVADRCDGSTLFKVRRGTVVVRDFIKDNSVVLQAGQSYVAKVDIGRLP